MVRTNRQTTKTTEAHHLVNREIETEMKWILDLLDDALEEDDQVRRLKLIESCHVHMERLKSLFLRGE